jgi:hypothetical protein
MSRTFRRKNQVHEYFWALRDWDLFLKRGAVVLHQRSSPSGRKATAVFHSDREITLGSSAPRWYRKVFDRRRRTRNERMMRRWMMAPDFDPVFEASHKHEANWSWW